MYFCCCYNNETVISVNNEFLRLFQVLILSKHHSPLVVPIDQIFHEIAYSNPPNKTIIDILSHSLKGTETLFNYSLSNQRD